ncbi:MAG: PQQ-binding-like beta-propeller repeat protein [Rhodospirillales bacterium]|nr:PQQ-binding-like beta-propeller repeat protein [Rhodospirillales bacterium]
MSRVRPAAYLLALALAAALPGCDWFGDKKVPLEGERISVLLHQRVLKPDVEEGKANILLPEPTPNPEWPQSGGYPNNAMHHILVGENLRLAWKSNAGSGQDDYQRISSPPIVADGRVYTIDSDSRVSAFDAKTGDRIWRVDLTDKGEDEGHVPGGLAFAKGRVYATTGFAQVVALDAKTGAEAWRQALPGPMRAPPTVRAGTVYVVTVDNHVFALDADSGQQLWTHAGIAESAAILGGAAPAVDGGVVVVPFSSGEIVALRADTGRLLWSDSLATARRTDQVSTLSHVRGRPVIDRGRVFALSHGGIMVSIDLRTGRRVWERQIGGLETPWIAGDYLFVVTSDSEIVAIGRADGRILWVQSLPRWGDEAKKKKPITWTGPVLASDRLIVAGSHGQALTVSPYTGELLGFEPMPDGVSVPPVVADGSVYFLANDADIVAYR